MSYNQSFAPQAGQGNLSAQFGGGQQYRPNEGGSAPRDIPGHSRRQSSVSGGYPHQYEYGMNQPSGGYGTSPGMAYSPHRQSFATLSGQHLGAPPTQQPYGSPTAQQQYSPYGTSPQHIPPMGAGSYPSQGWQQPHPQYGPSSYPPTSTAYYHAPEHRRKSSTASSYSHHSGDSSDKPKKSGRKTSVPSRYDSPRRPTMTDSVLAAWSGLKGAFDARK